MLIRIGRRTEIKQTQLNSVYVPTNLHLDQLLTPKELKTYGDRIRFITNFLIMNRIYNKDRYEKRKGWVSVHSKVWLSALGRSYYRKSIGLADKHGVIEIDHSYAVADSFQKGYTKRYRLREPFRSSEWHGEHVKSRSVLNFLKRPNESGDFQPVHGYLRDWVERVQLVDPTAPFEKPEHETAFKAVRELRYFRIRDAYGRFHTNLSNFPKVLRECWRIDGQELVEVDIRNCQPLLLAYFAAIFVKRDFSRKLKGFKINKRFETNVSSKVPYVYLKTSTQLLERLGNRNSLPKDILQLLEVCEAAKFVEHLVVAAGFAAKDAADYKLTILEQLYDDWRPGRRKPGYLNFVDVIRRDFPSVYDVCQFIKANEYADLSRLMQRLESFVLIENACRWLMENRPDIPVITVHDAIFTTAEHKETVRRVIRETFTDLLGVNVAFKGDKTEPATVPSGLFLPAETLVY